MKTKKPCTFCGSDYASVVVRGKYVSVVCDCCRASGPEIEANALNLNETKELAIKMWNRRVFVWE